MAVQQPTPVIHRTGLGVAVVVVAVAHIGEVAGQHLSASHLKGGRAVMQRREAGVEVAGLPFDGLGAVARPAAIVVAAHQVFGAVQVTHERQRVGDLAERHVAQHPHRVVGCHHIVPAGDEGVVHLLGVGERTAAVLDDVAVPEVQITAEPRGHGHQCGRSAAAMEARCGSQKS